MVTLRSSVAVPVPVTVSALNKSSPARTQLLVTVLGPLGSFLYSLPFHASSVALALTSTVSLNAKLITAMPSAATISGARIWCAEMPAAFMITTSLF